MFGKPVPFAEAIEFLAGKDLLPTSLDSGGLRQLSRDVRSKSLFSAQTMFTDVLNEYKERLGGLVKGEFNEATARAEIQDVLNGIGYKPDAPGTIQDLSSDQRIRLVLTTNLQQAQNYGHKLQATEPIALFQFPAWELVRKGSREEPRDDWEDRFEAAGGELLDGRLIALKDDSVWDNLGDPDLFDDGIDAPYPPYAFNSGMGWREVPRIECIELGIVEPGEMPQMEAGRFFEE